MARTLREDRGYNEQEIVVERPDGDRRTVLAYANPLHDAAGRVHGAVNILVDITERKQAEDALREADRRKSEFLAMLSHELRNPLAPLRNGLQIIRLAKDDPGAIEESRGMMERQLSQLVRLIDDLLDLSRISNGKVELRKQRITVADAVQDAVETCRHLIEAQGHELTVTLPSKSITVEADRTRLAQVFANLLNNSAKYTPPHGHIWLTVERQGSDVIVTVRDTGVGIPKKMLPKVFDMFLQVERSMERSEGGLGIGLNLVQRLVELHGGSVEAQSEGPGRGSAFIVRLPVSLAPRTGEGPHGEVEGPHSSSHYRILVVDDNKDSAISLALLLKILGHETRTAHDGVEAVEVAAAMRPDVLLLDIGLPRLNGYEACRRIREQPWGKNLLIIALSGWGQEEDKIQSKEAGFNFHMVKPVDPADLAKLLAGQLLTPA